MPLIRKLIILAALLGFILIFTFSPWYIRTTHERRSGNEYYTGDLTLTQKLDRRCYWSDDKLPEDLNELFPEDRKFNKYFTEYEIGVDTTRMLIEILSLTLVAFSMLTLVHKQPKN